MSYTTMWRALRLTARRGRSALPLTFLRSRACRRVRAVRRLLDTWEAVRFLAAAEIVSAMAYLPVFPTLRRMTSPA
jgi:hypothetical protein